MQNPFAKENPSQFDEAIEACLKEMQTYGLGSPEYEKAFEAMKSLAVMREAAQQKRWRPSPDMVVMCLANLGIVVVAGLIEAKGHILPDKWSKFTGRVR